MTSNQAACWDRACLAVSLFAVDPAGLGGVLVRARAGPVRDRWLSMLASVLGPGVPIRRMPIRIPDSRLLGGLDLPATLAAGKPIAERGFLAESHDGVVLLPMAERIDAHTAARLAAVADTGSVRVERDGFACSLPTRFGLVALDEGIESDEQPHAMLAERLAFRVDLTDLSLSDAPLPDFDPADSERARTLTAAAGPDDEAVAALCGTAHALGVDSPRAALFALRAARACAALSGRTCTDAEDVAAAAALVLAPRATRLPAAEPESEAVDEPEQNQGSSREDGGPPAQRASGQDCAEPESQEPSAESELEDVVLEAARAAIPARLLDALRSEAHGGPGAGPTGRRGAGGEHASRGRPAGTRRGDPRTGARLDVVETLRAAAPWQRLRRSLDAPGRADGVRVRSQDFRVKRLKRRRETTVIFAVDASGSSAYRRLAEAKGAVEMLLADCYARRDHVALIAFRGKAAELLLPPTRSLSRAKRCLASLPGGGGTPLACALEAAGAVADSVARKGGTPTLLILTDGAANIARDGTPGRERAFADALAAARELRRLDCPGIVIDTSPLPQRRAAELATAANAKYLALPCADATVLSRALRAHVIEREAA